MTSPVSGTQTAGAPSLSIVLVHGAFVDGSGWQQVHGELVDRGFEMLVAQHPTTSLEGDVAVTERLIVAARHPVLLVATATVEPSSPRLASTRKSRLWPTSRLSCRMRANPSRL